MRSRVDFAMGIGKVGSEDGCECFGEADGVAGESEYDWAVDRWEFAEEPVLIHPEGHGVRWCCGWG